jgi:hypothetical protein
MERAIEEAKRKKLGAQWMIVGEGGVAQVGSLDALLPSHGTAMCDRSPSTKENVE